MSQWLVPALMAPLVLGLVTVGGWFVTYVFGMRQERLRRLERVIDVQTALAAEIRGYLAKGAGLNFAEHGRRMAHLAKDLRADRYQTLDPASKVEVYQDYLAIMDYAFQLARQALLALQESQQDERIQ